MYGIVIVSIVWIHQKACEHASDQLRSRLEFLTARIYLDAPWSLSIIEPIRDRIKRLNVDWIGTLEA